MCKSEDKYGLRVHSSDGKPKQPVCIEYEIRKAASPRPHEPCLNCEVNDNSKPQNDVIVFCLHSNITCLFLYFSLRRHVCYILPYTTGTDL